MLVLLPGLFRNLPQVGLAAVVITASMSLADVAGTRRGQVAGLARHHDVRSHPDAERLPGLVTYRFRCAAAVRQRQDVPGRGHPAGPPRAGSAVDRGRRRADHRRGHDRVRGPLRARPPARRAGPEIRVRRTETPRPPQDRAVRAHQRDRAAALRPQPSRPRSTPFADRPARNGSARPPPRLAHSGRTPRHRRHPTGLANLRESRAAGRHEPWCRGGGRDHASRPAGGVDGLGGGGAT
jgi:hypothetical protein